MLFAGSLGIIIVLSYFFFRNFYKRRTFFFSPDDIFYIHQSFFEIISVTGKSLHCNFKIKLFFLNRIFNYLSCSVIMYNGDRFRITIFLYEYLLYKLTSVIRRASRALSKLSCDTYLVSLSS